VGGSTTTKNVKKTTKAKAAKKSESRGSTKGRVAAKGETKASSRGKVQPTGSTVQAISRIVVRHTDGEVPEGLPKKFLSKSTFNTHDIMHSPVEKTLKMIDKILAGERLFTM
jgi:hypothetical protein